MDYLFVYGDELSEREFQIKSFDYSLAGSTVFFKFHLLCNTKELLWFDEEVLRLYFFELESEKYLNLLMDLIRESQTDKVVLHLHLSESKCFSIAIDKMKFKGSTVQFQRNEHSPLKSIH